MSGRSKFTPGECQHHADSLSHCTACGRRGHYIVHPNLIGQGAEFMIDALVFSTCECGQNRFDRPL